MSRPNTFQVALSVDDSALLRRTATNLGLKPATFARMMLAQALRNPYVQHAIGAAPATQPKKAKRP